MAEGEWRKVCGESELEEGVPRLVTIEKEGIYLVRLEGKIHAVDHECPHYQGKLEEGILFGNTVVCRSHGARFDVTTGRMTSPPSLKDLPVYPVRVEDGEVWVGAVKKPRLPKVDITDPRVFLIIGAGAAGNAAAETLRREGFLGRIVMVTPEADEPYDRPDLSKDFMAGKSKLEWLPLRSAKFYEAGKIEVMTGRRVVSLDLSQKRAVFESGEPLSFDKALLATGGTPRKPDIPGAGEDHCFTLRSLADARAIAGAAEKAKSVVIVGAGFIGMELAGSFRERGLAVTVIAPENLPLVRVLGDRIAGFLRKRHEEKGVTFHLGTTVIRISGTDGVKSLELSDGGRVSGDFVVFGLGIEPAVEYLIGTDLVQDGVVPVSPRLQTRYPDIFAAGDIASVSDEDGEARRVEHWTVAERQGLHAARSMLGSTDAYREIQLFWTRQTGISVRYAGYIREWDDIVYRGDVEGGKFLAGFCHGGACKAAASVGLSNELSAVEEIFRLRRDLPAERLADPGFDLLKRARA